MQRAISQSDTTAVVLQEQFEQRMRKNPAFSLRAMARLVGSSPSYLSELLSGKKHLSQERALEFSRRLELRADEAAYFCALAQYQKATSAALKAQILATLDKMRPRNKVERFATEQFVVLKEWHHVPMLELTELEGFEFNARTIGKRLGIPTHTARAAMERLLRLGLLHKTPDGAYRKSHAEGVFEAKGKNEALRAFHKAMIEQGKASLENQAVHERYVGSETMAFDARDLPKVELILNAALEQVSALAINGSERRDVYHLGVQFFRVTKKHEQ